MTDSKISRRDLVVLAGTAVAVSACKPTDRNSSSAIHPGSDKSVFPIYGSDPNPPAPEPTVSFVPKVLTLVRIGREKRSAPSATDEGSLIDVNYASVFISNDPASPLGNNDRQDIAKKWLKKLDAGNGKPRYRFNSLSDETKPGESGQNLYKFPNNPMGSERERDNFDNFGSNQQTEFYFWLDFDHIEIFQRGTRKPNDPPRPYLISFSPLLSDFDPATGSEAIAYENWSYFAREVTGHGLGRGLLIAVKNYFLDDDKGTSTQKDQKPPRKHAMNLHFVARNGNTKIPMIIDPDTGNGYGNGP